MTQTFSLALRNGVVVNQDGAVARDVAVRDGKIAMIGSVPPGAAEVEIDCSGLHVLPGVVDSQVHFREPGFPAKEDLESGSRAAVLGGVTAVFEMPNTNPATIDAAALADKVARASGRMHCDFAFFIGASAENAIELPALEGLPGCCGVKLFMGSSTGDLLVAEDDGVRAVLSFGESRVAVHAEDEAMLRDSRDAVRMGDPSSHPDARPRAAAISATRRLLAAAAEAKRPVHILHVSTAEEVPLLADAKGLATMEATPQHLTLAAPDAYERLGTFAQMNPPIRTESDREALWAAIRDGVVDVLGSDHAPHTKEEKAKAYPASPSGMPGVQTLVPIMLDHVNAGRLSLERFVDLTAHGPARIFGMIGKGRIAAGYDADFTIIDLAARRRIDSRDMASRCGWTPYDGMTVTGWPMMTVVRGVVVMREGEIVAPSRGATVRFQHGLR